MAPLNDHARAALAELSDLGVRDPTPDEIVALQELGARLDAATDDTGLRGRGLPVRVGDVLLWPMTCAGQDWWALAAEWFRGSGALLSAAWAFCLAHGRDAGMLESLSERAMATEAVRAWFRGIIVTLSELDEACGLVEAIEAERSEDAARMALAGLAAWDPERRASLHGLYPELAPRPAEDTTKRTAFFWRRYCAELAAIAGGSPAEWYGRERRETVHCYALAVTALAMRAGGAGPEHAPEAVVAAVRALRQEIAAIAERRKARKDAAP